ncbi:MAG: M15 family metallopeptidase [Bacteroidota bacterium]
MIRDWRFLVLMELLFIIFYLACSDNPKPSPPVIEEETVTETTKEETAPPLPPPIQYDYDTSQWSDLQLLDSTIIIDLRYATTDNFVKEKMYDCPRCFLRPPAAKALVALHREFQQQGLGIKVFDCYRPRPIQQKLWDKVPNASYVTPPQKGSMHNRGLAVDLTLVDQSGKELEMGTAFDFFGKRAHHTFTDLPKTVLDNRKLLKERLLAYRFKSIRTEWWHYSYTVDRYPLSDMLWDCPQQ